MSCRRRHIGRQQQIAHDWFAHHRNEHLGFVTVVLEAASDVAGLGDIIARSREATRKRIAACRKTSSRWDDVYLRGWHEVDAVAPDQIPLLPPKRRALVERLVNWSSTPTDPCWIGSYHGIIHLNGLEPQDVELEFSRQWKFGGQVDVQPFYLDAPVKENLDRMTSYANKFGCRVSLNDGYIEPWGADWEATYFTWLQGHRNAFEPLRISVQPLKLDTPIVVSIPSLVGSKEPLPYSFSRVPMSLYNTGAIR